jgi:iron complex outermembrane receptor protein
MEDITVTATRLDQDALKIPQAVTIIDRARIEQIHPNNVVDVLRNIPGIIVRDLTGSGINATLDMRGFGETAGRHVAVFLDDRPLNPIDMSDVDFSTIAVDSIERIEVIHGASSVLYGDGAIGGVVNIITREGKGKPESTLEIRGGSYEMGQIRGTTQGSHDMLSWFANAHYGGGHGYRDNNEYRSRGIGLNLRLDPSDTLSFLLDGGYEESHYSLPGGLSEADYNRDRRSADNHLYDWASRQAFNIRGQVRKDLQEGGVFSANIYYRYQNAEAFYLPSESSYITNNIGLQPKYSIDYHLGPLSARSVVGLDYNHWRYDTESFGGFTTNENQYTANTIAGYLNQEIGLTQALTFNLGGRLHYADYKLDVDATGAKANYDSKETQYAFNAGLSYNFLGEQWNFGKIYTSVGRSFRYPKVDEYINWDGSFNPDLKAEYGMDYELGTQLYFPCGLNINLSLYWLDMKQEIAYVYDPVSGLGFNENLDDTVHRGIDLSVGYDIGSQKQHHIFASIAYQDVYFNGGDNDGKLVPLVPAWSGTLGGKVTIIDNLHLTAQINFLGERYYGSDYANDGEKMSATATVDLGADYTWDKFTFFVNVRNLFNTEYSDVGFYSNYSGYSYYPNPGFVCWGGVIVKF